MPAKLSLAAALAIGVSVAGCGGGGTTTIIKTTVTQSTSTVTTTATGSTSTQPAVHALMSDPLGHSSSEPSSFAFSVDGDLVARGLTWSNWGAPSASASGTFLERKPPSTREVSLQGSVTVSGLKPCRGASYYTRAVVSLPASAPFQPTPIPLGSPCG